MTIKSIKEKYQNYKLGVKEKNMFVTNDYNDGNGKVVIIVNSHSHRDIGKHVKQIVRVSDGKELIESDRCRPCDNLDDAIDVAGEMLAD